MEPDVRIRPLHPGDRPSELDWLLRVEFGCEGVVGRYGHRRTAETQRDSRDHDDELHCHEVNLPQGAQGARGAHGAQLQRLYHSCSLSPGGILRVISTLMVSPSQCLTSCCFRRLPYMNSSENSMHG